MNDPNNLNICILHKLRTSSYPKLIIHAVFRITFCTVVYILCIWKWYPISKYIYKYIEGYEKRENVLLYYSFNPGSHLMINIASLMCVHMYKHLVSKSELRTFTPNYLPFKMYEVNM